MSPRKDLNFYYWLPWRRMIYVLAGFITYQPSVTRPLNPQTHPPGGSHSVFVQAAAPAQHINFNKEPLLFVRVSALLPLIHSPAQTLEEACIF